MLQVVVQHCHLLPGRALLGSVDGGGAVGPCQGVVDVAGDHYLRLGQSSGETVEHQGTDVSQSATPGGHMGNHHRPQGGQHSGAAVRARATADPDHELAAPGVERRCEGLAEPATGSGHGCEDRARQPDETAGVGHLHHRGGPAPGVRRLDGGTGGSGDRDGHAFESAGDRRIERAVAAIGDRQAVDHGSGNLTAYAAGQRVGDLGG